MIDTIKMIDFMGLSDCKCNYFQCFDSFVPINYSFEKSKKYCIISDFHNGSWGLASCIGGNCAYSTGTVYVNSKITKVEDLKHYSCFVAANELNGINHLIERVPVKIILNHYLKESGLRLRLKDIQDVFHLSNNNLEKPFIEQDKSIWMSSLAMGYVQGKDIFCFPWLNENEIDHFLLAHDIGVIDFLKDNNKIVVVPSNQIILSSYCDNTIVFEGAEVHYS